MSFGTRRFLTAGGRNNPSTIITFSGTIDKCEQVTIENDTNGNTVLGNGTFNSFNDLRTNTGTGGVNAPMVVELTPGRVYTIAIIKDHSGTGTQRMPNVSTNVATDTANLALRYGNLSSLNNPPPQNLNTAIEREFDNDDIGSGEPALEGPNDGSGNPTPPAIFLFENAPFVDDKIIVASGFAVDNTHDDFLALTGGGSRHTAKGLYVRYSVAQSSNGGEGRMRVSVTEGYFL